MRSKTVRQNDCGDRHKAVVGKTYEGWAFIQVQCLFSAETFPAENGITWLRPKKLRTFGQACIQIADELEEERRDAV